MDVIWLTPIAWLGLALLAVPVLIHLLTNPQTRHVPFPTLRFLRRTRLAAIRRRTLQNWLLLALRMSILTAAVGALAGPVLVSTFRKDQWQRRVARAVVVVPGTSSEHVAPLVEAEGRGSFAIAVFTPTSRVADGFRDAALWLLQQPPAAQEIVVVGNLKQGAIGPADKSIVPPSAGLRFLPVPSDADGSSVESYFLESRTRWRARATPTATGTRVAYVPEGDAAAPITVRAAAGDEAAAAAALSAVLARGIETPGNPERRVVGEFEGSSTNVGPGRAPAMDDLEPWMRQALAALPDMQGAAEGGVLVVRIPRRASAPDAADLLQTVARVALAEDRSAQEPSPIAAQTLAQWSRPPGTLARPPVQDEGDRRWLWGAVLALMAAEMAVRRTRTSSAETAEDEEARVA